MYKSEISIQAECFQWAWNNHPQTRRCLLHIPNGGRRTRFEANELKASGMVAGAPDLIFVWAGRVYAFEMKNQVGVVSEAQRKLHEAWKAQGLEVKVLRSAEEFRAVFLAIVYGVPLPIPVR